MDSNARALLTSFRTRYVAETRAVYVADPRDARLPARLLAWDVIAHAGSETASYHVCGADGVYLLSSHAALATALVTVLSRDLAQTWFRTQGVRIVADVIAFPPELADAGAE
jgi:hypothetical protein